MEDRDDISEDIVLEYVFNIINKANIPVERSVIVEKYKKPTIFIESAYFENFSNASFEICWFNSSHKLHSFNDRPSKISSRYGSTLEIEWRELPTHSKADGMGFGGHRLT